MLVGDKMSVAVCKVCIAMLWSLDNIVTMELTAMIQSYWESGAMPSIERNLCRSVQYIERNGERWGNLQGFSFRGHRRRSVRLDLG